MTKTFVFACDLQYGSEERYFSVVKAEDLKAALKKACDKENEEREDSDSLVTLEDYESEIVSEAIEISEDGIVKYYNHFTYQDEVGFTEHPELKESFKENII